MRVEYTACIGVKLRHVFWNVLALRHVPCNVLCLRVAAASYSDVDQITLLFDFDDDLATADGSLLDAEFKSGTTATAAAFKFAFDTLIDVPAASVGRRDTVPLRVLLVTDGSPTGESFVLASRGHPLAFMTVR